MADVYQYPRGSHKVENTAQSEGTAAEQLDQLPMRVRGVFAGTVAERHDATQRSRKLRS